MITALHVLFGSVALVAAPAALFVRKGGIAHRRCGIAFVCTMSIVLVSAGFLWQAKGHIFLVPLASVSAYLIFSGYRAIARHRRRAPDALQDRIDVAAACAAVASGATSVYLGIGASTPLMRSIEPALIGIGSIAIAYALNEVLGFTAPRMRVGWLLAHFSSMLAGYISAVTAFVVINAHDVPMLLRWLVPSTIGATTIVTYTLRHVQLRLPRADSRRAGSARYILQPSRRPILREGLSQVGRFTAGEGVVANDESSTGL